MAIIDNHWNLSPEIQKHIHLLARKEEKRMRDIGLAGHFDADDLAQELNCAVERQKDLYNPEKASQKTYVERIALGTFGHLEAFLTRQERDVRITGSLQEGWQDDKNSDEPSAERFDFSEHPDADLFTSHVYDTDDADLAIWLREISRTRLKPEQSQLLHWLVEGGTIRELAEETGTSDQTWYSRLKALQKIFRNLPELHNSGLSSGNTLT